MSRSTPWRNKPTQLITQMLPIAKQLKLYLVNQIGPTSLILKDDNQNKFKVVIGNTISCSCNVVKNDHCIHTLFVMLKKFKVSQTNPIIWQASYLDSELDGMTQQKYQDQVKVSKKITAKQFLKKARNLKKQQNNDQDFPPLGEDQMCPICYEQMDGQCYSTCETCHKSLHTKCFKVWTKHKQDSQAPVTCPMCRTKFITPMKIIFRDLQRWQSRFSTHKGTYCKGCGQKNIKGFIYKCLVCPHTDLCKMCYEGNQHIQHDIFSVKQLANDKWRAAPLRVKKTRKQLFQPIQDLNLKQLPTLEQKSFILHLLPTVKQFNSKQAKSELGIVGNELLTKNNCVKCGTHGNDQMLKLICSHSIHPQCLLYMAQNQQYFCPIDNQIICPGYWNALGIKIKVKQNKNLSKNKQSKLSQKGNRIQQSEFVINNQRKKQNNHLMNQDIVLNKINRQGNRNLSLGTMKQTLGSLNGINGMNRISGIKPQRQSKNMRPPSIPKKPTLMERRQQIQSLSIGGLGMGGIGLGLNNNLINMNNQPQQYLNEFLSIGQQNLGSQKLIGSKNSQKFGLFSNKVIQR